MVGYAKRLSKQKESISINYPCSENFILIRWMVKKLSLKNFFF